MRPNICFSVLIVFGFFFSVTKGFADCPDYWTEAYKRQNCPGYGGGGGYARPTYTPPPVYQPSPQELKRQQAIAISNQSDEANKRGDYEEGIRLSLRALEMGVLNAKDTNTTLLNIGYAYYSLGRAAVKRGDDDEALRLDKLALEYNQRSNDKRDIHVNL